MLYKHQGGRLHIMQQLLAALQWDMRKCFGAYRLLWAVSVSSVEYGGV